MGLSLLAPLFLAVGVVSLAIPLLVHLIHRERSETIAFPSLMFLQRIPYRSVRRQKIRHWVLFLLRCLALVLLAAAFSRPFLARGGGAAAGVSGARELVVLLDQSYSMGYRDHWQRALAAARRAVEEMGNGDRGTVVLFADEAHAVNQATADRASLLAAIDSARVSSGGTKYTPALKLAWKILEDSPLPRRAVVLITDFQRVGWTPDEAARLPNGTALTRVDLSDARTSNVAVTGVSFQRDFPAGRERVLVSARLTNQGTDGVRGLAVALDLNGREIQSRSVDLSPRSAMNVTFAPFPLPEGTSRGTVRAAPDQLPADNVFHFTLTQGQAVSVLVVEPTGGATDRSLYLRRALAVGDRPAFRSDVKRALDLVRGDLEGRSVVILDDVGTPSAETARNLAQYVSGGGGLLVLLGERSAATAFAPEANALLPVRIGSVVDRATISGGKLTQTDFSHPAFELFSAPRSGDFSAARFFRYRRLEMRDTTTEPQPRPAVLARFDDGNVALVERRHGKGTVLVWASTLDTYWNDLALQPVYLPFVHELVKHTAGYVEAAPWFTVGQAVDLGGPKTERGELIGVAPSGRRTVLPAGTTSRVLAVSEQGFYEVRPPGGRAEEARTIAVNLDLAESDLTPLDPAEFAAAVEPRAGAAAPSGVETPLAPEERERRQAVWWYLLVAAFLLLAGETVVSNRLSEKGASG